MRALRRRLMRVSCTLASAAVLYGPAEPRNEVGVSLGGGSFDYYRTSGCNERGPQRQGRFAEWSAVFRQERERTTLVAEVAGAAGREHEPSSGESWTWHGGIAAARWGAHWRYFAFELGPALYYDVTPADNGAGQRTTRYMTPMPSLQVRVGPDWLHLWSALGVAMPGGQIGGAGLGHSSERVRLRLGVGMVTMVSPGWGVLAGEAAVAVRPNLWLGLAAQGGGAPVAAHDGSMLSMQATMAFRF